MNNAKYPAQTPEEMTQELTAKRQTSKLYKRESDTYKAEAVSALIDRAAAQLEESERRGRISFTDFNTVQEQTFLYLKACETTGVFPSMSGLARSLGYSRHALYNEIDRRTTPATADLLESFRDLCSDVLAQASLQNNANSIVSIFLQKALYNMRESVELVVSPPNPLGESTDAAQVKRLIEALPAADADYEIE
ncbi:MAG: hypothetical protein ACOX8Q_05200 [Christensenellales bacterium]